MNNRPELEKGSRKYYCPECRRKTFVYYRMPDGSLIDESVGRCERIDSCTYHKKPREWFAEHPTKRTDWKPIYPTPHMKKEIQPTGYIPIKFILDRCKTRNSNFVYYLLDLFDWETLKNTIDPYFLGCTEDKAVIFPQIDEQGRCRTAKVQQYDKYTGKRQSVYLYHGDKAIKPHLPNPYNLEMCLFGLHLIRSEKNQGKTICICESEKSAVIAAGCMPDNIWMAAGALNWLNINKLKPLKGWNIILFPDTSKTGVAFDTWKKVMEDANKIGFSVHISTILEDGCTDEEKQKGYDIADYLIDRVLKVKHTKETINNNTEPPEQSNVLKDMIKVNPRITNLINSFDLVEVKQSTAN